jgi:hypothetical protein
LNLKQTDVGKKTSRFDWQRGAKHHTRVESSMQKTKTGYLKKNLCPDTLKSGSSACARHFARWTVCAP